MRDVPVVVAADIVAHEGRGRGVRKRYGAGDADGVTQIVPERFGYGFDLARGVVVPFPGDIAVYGFHAGGNCRTCRCRVRSGTDTRRIIGIAVRQEIILKSIEVVVRCVELQPLRQRRSVRKRRRICQAVARIGIGKRIGHHHIFQLRVFRHHNVFDLLAHRRRVVFLVKSNAVGCFVADDEQFASARAVVG